MKYTTTNLKKLEALVAELQYTLRYEKGHFQAGYCLVKARRVIIINKFYAPEARWHVLLDLVQNLLEESPPALAELSEEGRMFLGKAFGQKSLDLGLPEPKEQDEN